jgi:uncharacterized protein (TIGR02271 family)
MTRTIVALFDTAAEAEQASRHLAMDVGGVRGEVYGSGRAKELSSLSIPGDDTAAFSEGVRRGGVVVYAEVPDAKFETVATLLEADGAVDINEREATWRREGWTGSTALDSTPATTTGTMPLARTASGSAGMPAATPRQGMSTGDEERISVIEERLRVGKRETAHGRVRIRSYVVETPVQEQVSLREEHVQVERRPVDRPAGTADDSLFRERTIEASESAEEAVVSKEARVKEEVVVRKTTEERTETVSDTVRRTEVEIEDERASTAHNPTTATTRRNDPI